MKSRRKSKPPESRTENPDNTFTDALRTQCAKAAVRWLKEAVNIQRPIASLTLRELEGMAEAVTAEWIKLVLAEKRKAPETLPADYQEIFG